MNWLTRAIGHSWLSLSEVPINVQDWKTIYEEQMLLWELGIRGALFEPQFSGQNRL